MLVLSYLVHVCVKLPGPCLCGTSLECRCPSLEKGLPPSRSVMIVYCGGNKSSLYSTVRLLYSVR